MRSGVDTRLTRTHNLVCRTFLILFVAIAAIAGIFSGGRIPISSASPQDQATVRFESALRQQQQRARLLVRSSTAESRFQRLSVRAVESGVIPVIVTLRVAYSSQLEVRGEIESQAQRYEIGRLREGILDELVGYDPASIKQYDKLPVMALRVNASGIESLRQSDNILDIQEDALYRTSKAQRGSLVGGTSAWASGFTGEGQTVAILDTGVDKNHPMLAGKVVSEACYSTTNAQNSSTSVCPEGASSSTEVNSGLHCPTGCEHGTHVAGIAAGKTVIVRDESFSGVAKDANIIAIQVFSQFNSDAQCGGAGKAPCVSAYGSDVISGLLRVYDLRNTYSISSANLSMGGGQFYSNCDSDNGATKAVIDLLRAANIATVVASGNEKYTDSLASPACISTAVSVGATLDTANTVATYSNSASFLSLLAPGSGITSAVPGAGYETKTGTSMASPHVAGAWAIAKQKSPSASVQTILSVLQATGVNVTDTRNSIVKSRIAIDRAIPLLAPNAPTSLVATAISTTRINLTWTDTSTNETNFILQRKTGVVGTWATIASPAANAKSYQDDRVVASTAYYYRIYATSSGGTSAASREATATTFGPTAVPTGVTATAFSSTQINLSWTDAATNETGYRIERRQTTGTGSTTTFSLLANLGAGVTTYSSTGLLASTGYAYRVSAVAPGGALVSAAAVTATTLAVTVAPTGFTATPISKSQINLRWTDAATNETGYQVERRLTSATVWGTAVPLGAGVTTYSDTTGLAAAVSYTYRVSAIAPGGALVSAATVAATTFGETAVPTGVTATAFSSTQINLGWTDAATNETGYRIERRLTTDTSPSALSLVANIAANTSLYQNTGLAISTGYTYVVSAIAPGGALVSAATVAATTFGPTAVPTGVTATPFSSARIDLSWTDAATNETGYRISQRPTTGTVWTDLTTLAANATSYINTGLTGSTGYTYRVSAVAPGGALVSAADVTATTFAVTAAPTGVTATAFSSTQINLGWTDAATNETGYKISVRPTTGTGAVWTDLATLAPNATSYSHTGLAVATGYTYRVSAVAPWGGGTALVSAADIAATTFGPTEVPTGVTAAAFSSTQINLSWVDAATNETGYKVERRLTADTSPSALSLVANIAANITSYQDTGLANSTGYTYVVSAIAPGGALVSAAPVAATTYGPTAAPTGVTATPFSSMQLNLSWTDAATNETGYRISQRPTTGTVWTDLTTLAANATSYGNTGLLAATGYTYRVSAVAPGGALMSAADVAATTLAATAAPTGFTATPISKSQINLSWVDAATNETGYKISVRPTTGTGAGWTDLATLGDNATSYSHTGLAVATGYTYRVSSVAPWGALVSAADIAATTFGETAVPTGVMATAFSSTQINLGWVDAATNETGYRIERRLTSDTSPSALSLVADIAANITSYQNTGLANSTGYTYVVSAIAPGGALVSAATVAATTFGPTAVPTGVTATAFSSTQINLSWTDAATNETGYRIERRQTTGTGSTTAFSLLVNLGAGVTTYSNTGLLAATGYAYRVSAVAPGGALVSAAEVAATTFGTTAAPTGFTATPISKSQINLRWVDVATNEAGYQVERRLTSATEWGTAVPLGAGVTTYSDTTGLTAATSYTYRVSAIAPGGALLSAATVAATTFGETAVPTAVKAAAVSLTQINLNWTDVATNETGYRVSQRLTTGTVWTDLATLAANTTAYSNTGLTAGTGYTYRVCAVAPGGQLVCAPDVAEATLGGTETITALSFKTVVMGTPTQQYEVSLGGGVKLEMVVIPLGSFTMGSPAGESERVANEGPQRTVNVNKFVMGKYEVTQAQWRAVMGTSPSSFTGDSLPVEQVSWDDAKEFCRRLNLLLGLSGSTGYRLPTEAEWEYAARAGTTTPFAFGGMIYAGIVNYSGAYPYGGGPVGIYRATTVDVGSLGMANGWGLYDIHGNVWEWCEDDYHNSYSGAPVNGSAWVDAQRASDRVIRGGSWDSYAVDCRSSARYALAPNFRSGLLGFRLSRTLP
jgi:formylglycine-generating enzyme required for sulfatase activity/subtilisin family serine protease